MRNKRLGIIAVGVVVVMMLGTIAFLATLALADDRASPEDIGAYFIEDYASIRAADFEPSVSEQTARDAALDFYREGSGNPRGYRLEEGVVIRSTTAVFSGAKHGSGEWIIADRPVWIVVLDEIPVSLPCGPPRPEVCTVHGPRFNVAVDAETGEILTSELTGGGAKHPKWRNLRNNTQLPDPVNPPTPTPAP